jgi:capsular exopolysaccharide synthesis family protein
MAASIVKRYLLAVNRYKWVMPSGAMVGLALGGIVAIQPDPPPSYTAEVVLVANAPPITFSTIGTQVRQPLETFTPDTLMTDKVLETVSKEVKIDPRTLAKKIKVKITGGAGQKAKDKEAEIAQISLSYSDSDEKRAGTLISQLSRQVIEQSRLNNSARLRSIISAIEERLPQVKQDLAQAGQVLESFDRLEEPQLLAAQDTNLISSITTSQQQQRQLRLQLEGVNAQIRSLEEKLGLDSNQAYVSSALSADPIIANLRAQLQQIETQLAVLQKDLRSEHPQVVGLTKQQQALEEELRKRATEVIRGDGVAAPFVANIRQESSLDPARQQLANTLVNLQTQQESLQQQFLMTMRSEQDLRQQYSRLPDKRLERSRLEDQLKLQKTLHDQMQQKLVDAKAAEVETVSSLGLSQPPLVKPATVSAPKSLVMMLLVGGVVGLVVGAGLIFLLDMVEGTIYTPEDLREAIRQRDVAILGMLPIVESFEVEPSPIVTQSTSPYLEYYERFRSTLRLAENKALRVVMITSTIANEGKTVTAYNLAIASARAGKRTLLIEADLRSPSASQWFGITPDLDSQIEPLKYYGQISDCIRLAPAIENLYVVPSPGLQFSAASILESSEMRRLLEDARGRFDFVILDTPSLSQCNDALLLEPYTDGMVLVTRLGVTQQSLLEEAIDQLTETENIHLLGAVVNGVEVQVSPVAVLQPIAQPWSKDSLSEKESVTVSDPN